MSIESERKMKLERGQRRRVRASEDRYFSNIEQNRYSKERPKVTKPCPKQLIKVSKRSETVN